jgi:nicotinamide-nucleotide amidase
MIGFLFSAKAIEGKSMAKRNAGLLLTGNEVLTAKTRDSNGFYMATRLRQRGVSMAPTMVCGDDKKELLACLGFLAERADIILMTGGLGPTSDDLTAEVIAAFFEIPTQFNEEAWEACVSYFKRLGRLDVPEVNRKQALLPQGAQLLPNPNGTAVGFRVEGRIKGKSVMVCCMPGVPQEFTPMFDDYVLPVFQEQKYQVNKVWQVFGLGESAMQTRVGEVEKALQERYAECVISYQAHSGYVTYSILIPCANAQQEERICAEIESNDVAHIEKSFGKHILYRDARPLARYLIATLTEKGLKLALAESCTGGNIAAAVCAEEGASRCFEGGAVAYSYAAKNHLLGVPFDLLMESGAINKSTARCMAHGALVRFDSEVSLAVTGIAGPLGGNAETPVGTVCYSLGVRKDTIPDLELLQKRLADFGWQKAEQVLQSENIFFENQIHFGINMRREVIQTRAQVYGLCYLAACVSELKK